jgi:hypothetical protein
MSLEHAFTAMTRGSCIVKTALHTVLKIKTDICIRHGMTMETDIVLAGPPLYAAMGPHPGF